MAQLPLIRAAYDIGNQRIRKPEKIRKIEKVRFLHPDTNPPNSRRNHPANDHGKGETSATRREESSGGSSRRGLGGRSPLRPVPRPAATQCSRRGTSLPMINFVLLEGPTLESFASRSGNRGCAADNGVPGRRNWVSDAHYAARPANGSVGSSSGGVTGPAVAGRLAAATIGPRRRGRTRA